MKILRRAQRGEVIRPGSWMCVTRGERRTYGGERVPVEHVLASCPAGCRRILAVSETHSIGDDGTVRPSLSCECGWTGDVRLEGWV